MFDVLLAASTAAAPALATPVGGAWTYSWGRWGYNRAEMGGRGTWRWAAICAITGVFGYGVLWVITRNSLDPAGPSWFDRCVFCGAAVEQHSDAGAPCCDQARLGRLEVSARAKPAA